VRFAIAFLVLAAWVCASTTVVVTLLVQDHPYAALAALGASTTVTCLLPRPLAWLVTLGLHQ
jgi:hypothetical protein